MIAALKDASDPLFDDFEKADRRAAEALWMARNVGHYPLLGRGDINLYSLFVERAHRLVKPDGIVGLLTPSGIASDLSTSAFFQEVATAGHVKALYDFENRRIFFPDVHGSFKFCVMAISPCRKFGAAQCAFYLHSVAIASNQPSFPTCYGPSYIAGELADYLNGKRMEHVRGAPFHPQTQGKIERWHQTLKSRVLLENYFLPGDLEQQIEAFVEHYNYQRYHESLGNVTPADAYFGKAPAIIKRRERIKRKTLEHRRLQHRKLAA